MQRKLLIPVMLLAGVVLAVEFLTYASVWHDEYKLTVHIDTPADPPSAVGCCTCGRGEAERVADLGRNWSRRSRLPDFFPDLFDDRGAVANPFVGGPLKVPVAVTGRDSPFGREVARYQDRFLVVGAEWPDGRRVWKVVEIPDGRVSREVCVSLP
jgi:hypothetical protein